MITVWVLNSNERAINYYKKNGFEKNCNQMIFKLEKKIFEFIAMKKKNFKKLNTIKLYSKKT